MMEQEESQRWSVTQGVCTTDGAVGETVYGVCVRQGARVWRFEDADASPERVEQLVSLLNEEQPHPCHWEALLLDFVDGGLV